MAGRRATTDKIDRNKQDIDRHDAAQKEHKTRADALDDRARDIRADIDEQLEQGKVHDDDPNVTRSDAWNRRIRMRNRRRN
jgi:hypothetical protein